MRKILVVDDDADLLDLLTTGLTAAGFSVITASNGRDALEQARSVPDLVVLDLVLPEMDGFTVCQSLKRNRDTSAIPVLLLTGLMSELTRFAGLESGANAYVTKPVTLDELIPKIRSLMGEEPAPRPSSQVRARGLRRRARPAGSTPAPAVEGQV
jgi:DNA-binding response OmpR family regulator